MSDVGENTDEDSPSLKKHALSLVEGSGQGVILDKCKFAYLSMEVSCETPAA